MESVKQGKADETKGEKSTKDISQLAKIATDSMNSSSTKGLDEIARIARFDQGGFNKTLAAYRTKIISELSKGPKILELGCGDGLITPELAKHFDDITAVDGSQTRIERAKERLESVKDKGKVTFILSLFENFKPDAHFDTIVLSAVLEHVDDPITLLKDCRKWLEKDGYVIIVVPNAESIHRRLGKIMGIISDLHELADQDALVGHKRYYDTKLLKEDVTKSGLQIESIHGILLKPLPNSQMEKMDPGVIDAFYELGRELPSEHCAEICMRCILPRDSA